MDDLKAALTNAFERTNSKMHSSDRTLAANLGFADADKKNPRHDAACQYIVYNTDRILAALGYSAKGATAISEVPLQKVNGFREGLGVLSSVVGFADAIARYQIPRSRSYANGDVETWSETLAIGFEVKIGRERVGDIIRQIQLYRSLVEGADRRSLGSAVASWVVVTDYDLSETDKAALVSQDIKFLRLGPGFDVWVKSVEAAKTPVAEI